MNVCKCPTEFYVEDLECKQETCGDYYYLGYDGYCTQLDCEEGYEPNRASDNCYIICPDYEYRSTTN